MKRLVLFLSLIALMTASLSAMAQEVSIDLIPGWTWISYPETEAVDIDIVFGDFVPMEGDIIKSEIDTSRYINGNWTGGVTQLMPGRGYKYYSNRTEIVNVVLYIPALQFTVTTDEPTDITATSAVVGGTVNVPEGGHAFLHGVCWGTDPNPDINGEHTSDGMGMGNFTSSLEGLSPNTTYYMRAYIVTEYGITYGNEVSFTTLEGGSDHD